MKYNNRLYAELHLHLGGAISPRILYVHLQRVGDPILSQFADYDAFENHFRRPRGSLTEFLELHKFVERVQRLETLHEFVRKLVRGAYLFEDLCYIELRHTPFLRTDPNLSRAMRIAQMRDVVETIAAAAKSQSEYPIFLSQILCMHSSLDMEINRAIVDLAHEMPNDVCGVDLAGPDTLYHERLDEFVELFQHAKRHDLKTTAHLFETKDGCHTGLLPFLDRIGHGIQIPLMQPELLDQIAERKQCLEVCPTSYLKTGQLKRYEDLRPIFERCERAGVDVVLCTDNAGLHVVRLPQEYENLLIHEVISFKQMQACQDASIKHAFAWPYRYPARVVQDMQL